MPPVAEGATSPSPSDADRQLQLQQTLQKAERLEDRLAAVRDALQSCRRRSGDWIETARIRGYFASRATSARRDALSKVWGALEKEALLAMELERQQTSALEQRELLLELTAQAAWNDVDDLRRASHADRGAGLVVFERYLL